MSFLGEVKKGASGVRVVRYKASIEICESQEGSYVFDCRGDGPVSDPSHLGVTFSSSSSITLKTLELSL